MIPERRIASVVRVRARAGRLRLRSHPAGSRWRCVGRGTPSTRRSLIEAIVRTAAGVFEASASSIALDRREMTGELVYQSAWGAGGAREIVGVRLKPGARRRRQRRGARCSPFAVSDCRSDHRFAARIAAGTGYVPHTMLVVPLMRDDRPIGVLSLLGPARRVGHYGPGDTERAALFAELAVTAIEAAGEALPSLGARRPRVSPV